MKAPEQVEKPKRETPALKVTHQPSAIDPSITASDVRRIVARLKQGEK